MNEKKMAVTYQLLKRGSSGLITYAAISSEKLMRSPRKNE